MTTDDELGQVFFRQFRLRGILDITSEMPGFGASASEVLALTRLSESNVKQNELGAYLQLEKSTVSRMIDAMTAKGWVERTRDPANRRSQVVRLTLSGKRAARTVERVMRQRHERMLSRLSAGERQAVRTGLTVFVRALEEEMGAVEESVR
jgi:DNA-binding MarR family transcriptional regulator